MMGPLARAFRLPRRSRRQVEEEVDEEIRFHLEARAEQLARRGVDERTARQEAEHRFGDLEYTRRVLRESTRRREGRMRRREWLEQVGQDVGYALRQLRRQPAFAAIAVLTLAVGIAANAVMFGVVDRLLLRPPAHVVEPGQLNRIYFERRLRDGTRQASAGSSYLRYTELRDAAADLGELAAFFTQSGLAGGGTDSEQVESAYATATFFPLLGVRPAAGRFFGEAEDQPPDGTHVVVLGHRLWQRRFGGDPAAIGQTLKVGSTDFTIIGVAPPHFTGVELREVDVWMPAATIRTAVGAPDDWATKHNLVWLTIVARPRPGVAAAQLQSALTLGYSQSLAAMEESRPVAEVQPRIVLAPLLQERGPDRSPTSRVSIWLLGVATVVLLVACANVANLLLSRALRRRREIAVRLALGVSRGRLVGQFLIESLLLALSGAAVGLLLTRWAGALVRRQLLPDATWGGPLHDARVLVFTMVAAVLAGLLAGIVPALQASRPDLGGTLRSGGREGAGRRSRIGAALLVSQAALSVLLLVGAGLFVRSLHAARDTDLGFEPERLVVVTIDYRGARPDSLEARLELERRLLERLRAMPWVEAAGTSLALPFEWQMSARLFDERQDSIPRSPDVYISAVSTDYFEAMGTRIVRGRAFTQDDRFGAPPVMIVSESMARTVWRERDALGECVRVGRDTSPCAVVVGVARDIAQAGLSADSVMHLWLPEVQRQGNYFGAWAYLARVRGEARSSIEGIRQALQPELPGDAYVRARPMTDLVDRHTRSWRLGATMFVAFGGLSLLIAAVGLYGVIAYHVSQRIHELGVRQALGARGRDLVRAVVAEGLRITVIGLVIGILLALASGRWIAPLLYGVSPRDPTTYATVVAVLLAVAITASLAPARRAARVSPAEALRSE